MFPLDIRGSSIIERKDRLEEVLALCPLKLDLNQRVFSLSGGQAQAVCILRALIIRPRLLILDEPFAALDYEKTLILRGLVTDICKSQGLTVLFVSHDIDEAIQLGDQVVFLSRSPTQVVKTLQVELPFPRSHAVIANLQFASYREQAVRIFNQCVVGVESAE